MELEDSLAQHQDMNRTLEDQIHRNRSKDAEYQDKMESTAHEMQEMRKALKEAERKINVSLESEKQHKTWVEIKGTLESKSKLDSKGNLIVFFLPKL